MEKLPLRERKKLQTRQRILQAAEKLVSAQSYDSVTLAAICDEADIAPRTFFAYFPNKEAVFFYEKQRLHDEIANKLLQRPAGQTTFEALRDLLSPALDQYLANANRSFVQKELDLENDNSQLQMYGEHVSQQFEATFRECLARDLGEPADSLSVKLAAASANTTFETIMKQYSLKKSGASKQAIIDTLDKALIFLEAGIATLRTSGIDS